MHTRPLLEDLDKENDEVIIPILSNEKDPDKSQESPVFEAPSRHVHWALVEDSAPDVMILRRKWVWSVAVVDMVWVLLALAWSYYVTVTAVKVKETSSAALETLMIATGVSCFSLFLQFGMGFMLLISLLNRNDKSLFNYLIAYLVGSYILLGKILAIILCSIMNPNSREIFGYGGWRMIVSNIMNLTLRLVSTILIQKLLNDY